MKDNSDVQYELAVRIASRNIPVFTRVHSAVFASGAVTCILLVFLFFSTAIHIVSAFDFYRVQFARITGNYEERMMTVTESVPPQKNGGTYRIIFGEGSQRFSFNYLIYTPEAGEREVICYDRSSPEYAYPKNIYAIGEIVYDSVGSGSFALLVLAVLLFFQYPRYRLLSRLRRKGLYLKVREDDQYEKVCILRSVRMISMKLLSGLSADPTADAMLRCTSLRSAGCRNLSSADPGQK